MGKKGKLIEDVANFSPSFGNRPGHLVGRESVVADFLAGLGSQPGCKNRAVVILGQRGTGKTVLLWELADSARKQGFIVASPTVASAGMLERIVEKIQDDGESFIKDSGIKVRGGSVGALGFSVGLQFIPEVQESKSFQYKLTQLARKLTELGKGVLILVDELQANSPEVRELVIAYQELVGEGLNIALVMAGLPGAVSVTLNDKVLTFLNRAKKVALDPLRISDIDAFYARAFRDLKLKITPELRREAATATQGFPYLMQLIGYNLVQYAKDGAIDKEVVSQAILSSQIDFESDICKTALNALSGKDIEFLVAMSEDEGATSKVLDVADRMEVGVDYAQKYRKRLIDAGIIEAAARGQVRFAVPFLADYLRKVQNSL